MTGGNSSDCSASLSEFRLLSESMLGEKRKLLGPKPDGSVGFGITGCRNDALVVDDVVVVGLNWKSCECELASSDAVVAAAAAP